MKTGWLSVVLLFFVPVLSAVFAGPEFYIVSEEGIIEGLPEPGVSSAVPWTEGRRITGFCELGDAVVAGVNRGCPVSIDFLGGRPVIQKIVPDGDVPGRLFSEATLAGILPSDAGVVLHYFTDSMFSSNGAGADSAETADLPFLLEIRSDSGLGYRYYQLDNSFKSQNPGWEAVEAVRKNGLYYVSWKKADERKNAFRYIVHGKNGKPIRETTLDELKDAYRLRSAAESEPFKAAVSGIAADNPDTGIFLRTGGGEGACDYPEIYRFGVDQAVRSVELPAFRHGRKWYILQGTQLTESDGRRVRTADIGGLPGSFRLTGFWTDGENALVSWEESLFPDMGQAGMIYTVLSDIFPE